LWDQIYLIKLFIISNDWQQFKPYTNILWLDYILDKMITAVRYKKKTTKIHKTNIEEMKILRKELSNYESAFDFVKNCEKITSVVHINSVHV
jgi:serine/threonine-protein kinase haspin